MNELAEAERRCQTEEGIMPLLTEIRDLLRDNLTAANALAARRERDAARQEKHRGLSRDNALTERTENEKEENSPHTPLKGEKEKDKKETLNPRARGELFSQFWAAYPRRRRTNKSKCFAKYEKLLMKSDHPSQLASEILAGLEHMKAHPDWTKDDGEFVPMPMTFLNQERWIIEEVASKSRLDQIAADIVQEIGGIQ